MAHSNIKYVGSTPGADSNIYVILATANPTSVTSSNADPMNMNRDGACPENFFALAGVKKVTVLIDHNQAGTFKAYASQNRGTNWRQIDEVAVAAPAANSSTPVEFLVEGLRDFLLTWVNGGSAQSPWEVNLSLSEQRTAAI